MPGGQAKERDVEQIRFRRVSDGRLCGRDFGRDQMRLHRVRVDAIIQLRQRAVEIPRQRQAAAFVILEPLEFPDEVKPKLDGNPRREFKRDVLVCERAAVAPGTGNDAHRAGFLNPLLRVERETVQAGLNSNSVEFDGIKMQAGLNSFALTPKQWVEKTNAIGIVSKAGRYGGTYAHKDIAFEFASWVSVEFKLYLIKEFQRLKEDEGQRLSLAWNLNRTLAKLNYRIHTDAIKEHLIPPTVTAAQAAITYANEADVLNVALFGQTAKQWRETNPKLDGNMRDHATIEQLLVLANLEGMNAEFIRMSLPQGDRLKRLNEIAIRQLQSLLVPRDFKRLG